MVRINPRPLTTTRRLASASGSSLVLAADLVGRAAAREQRSRREFLSLSFLTCLCYILHMLL